MKRLLACLSLALLTLGGLPLAHAQQDVLKLAQRLNKKAMEDYDSLEFDSARQTLLSAIAKLRDAGQDETPTAARIYVDLGVVYIAGFKDRNRGIHEFVTALKIDPTVQLDPERATPELQQAFDEATKQAAGARPANPPPVKNVLDGVKGLQHNAVDEAPAGKDCEIKAQLGPDVAATKLFLFYRGAGQEDYVSVPMTQKDGEWIGAIPGEAMEGKSVQYYIEARDSRGRPVIAAGTAASPYIISITGGAGGPSSADVDVENTLAKMKKPGEEEQHPTEGRGFGRLFINLMGGTGIGIEPSGNSTEVAYLYQVNTDTYVPQPIGTTGFAFEPLHVSIEVGVNITKHIGVSALVRSGFTLTNNADSSQNPPLGAGVAKAQNDFAAMLRFRYSFLEGRARPFVHLGLGGGVIRHDLDISQAETDQHPLVDSVSADAYNNAMGAKPTQLNEVCPDHTNCVDTVAIGYVLLAVGGGLWIDLLTFKNGNLGFILDGDAIFALPVGGQFGINIDLQAGVGVSFL